MSDSLEELAGCVEPVAGGLPRKAYELQVLRGYLKERRGAPTRFLRWIRGEELRRDNGLHFASPLSETREYALNAACLVGESWLEWGDDDDPPTPSEERLARDVQRRWGAPREELPFKDDWARRGRDEDGASLETIVTDLLRSRDDDAEQLACALLVHAFRTFLYATHEARGVDQEKFFNAIEKFFKLDEPEFEPLRFLLCLEEET